MLAEMSDSPKLRLNIDQIFANKEDLIAGLEKIIQAMKEEKGSGVEPEWNVELLSDNTDAEDINEDTLDEDAEFSEMSSFQLICLEAFLYTNVTKIMVRYYMHSYCPEVQEEIGEELEAAEETYVGCTEEMVNRGISVPIRDEIDEDSFEQFVVE